MAFSSTINKGAAYGGAGFKVRSGTYTSNSGSTGGDIDTGLRVCHSLVLTPKGSAVATDAPVVNETFPVAGSAVTIVTAADEVGQWIATGF